MYKNCLALLLSISFAHGVIIENKSVYTIYAIEDTGTEENPNPMVVDAFFNKKLQIPPNTSLNTKNPGYLIAYVPYIFDESSALNFKFLGYINTTSRRQKYKITNDLILFRHLMNHER